MISKIEKKAVAVTGHRIVKDLDKKNLKNIFRELIEKEYNVFHVGMALGFDIICFKTLLELKAQYNIKIIACIPCENQDSLWSEKQKKEYRNLLNFADEKVILSKEYTSSCMQKRNEYMVDNSMVIVAYLKRNSGGTYNTVKYAVEKQKEIIYVN